MIDLNGKTVCLAKIDSIRRKSLEEMRELAELSQNETDSCCSEREMMDYALAKVVREGSAADIAQAIAKFIDYIFAQDMVASVAERSAAV